MDMRRRLIWLLCAVMVLLVLPGTAVADDGPPPAPDTFRIVGYTTAYEYEVLPRGYTRFHLTAEGDGETSTIGYDVSGVTGDLSGSFRFREWGIVDLDPETGEGSGRGINSGIITITTDDDSRVLVAFGGRSTLESVSGRFTVVEGTGRYRQLRGWGTYEGVPDFCAGYPPGAETCSGFYVDFTFVRSFYGHSE